MASTASVLKTPSFSPMAPVRRQKGAGQGPPVVAQGLLKSSGHAPYYGSVPAALRVFGSHLRYGWEVNCAAESSQ